MNKLLIKNMFIICIAVLLALGSVAAYAGHDKEGMDLTDPVLIPIPHNGFGTYEPSITADERTIYFAQFGSPVGGLDNPNADRDIYVTNKNNKKDEWSDPVRLPYASDGSAINSPWMDTEPMISADGRTMVFMSTRPAAYKSRNFFRVRKDQHTGEWGEPELLGYPFNTDEGDHCLIMTTTKQGEVAYWARSGEIYASRLEEGVWSDAWALGPAVNTAVNQCRFVPGKGNLIGIVTDHDANHHQEYLVRYDPSTEEWIGPRLFAGWNIGPEGAGASDGCGNFTSNGQNWIWSSGRGLSEDTYIFPGVFDMYMVRTEAMLDDYEDRTGINIRGTGN